MLGWDIQSWQWRALMEALEKAKVIKRSIKHELSLTPFTQWETSPTILSICTKNTRSPAGLFIQSPAPQHPPNVCNWCTWSLYILLKNVQKCKPPSTMQTPLQAAPLEVKPTPSMNKERSHLSGCSQLRLWQSFFFLPPMNPNVLVKIKFSSVKLSACWHVGLNTEWAEFTDSECPWAISEAKVLKHHYLPCSETIAPMLLANIKPGNSSQQAFMARNDCSFDTFGKYSINKVFQRKAASSMMLLKLLI